MALSTFHDLLEGENIVACYERRENGKVTGAIRLSIEEANISEKKGPAEYVLATYYVPRLSEKKKKDLENLCKKINCSPLFAEIEAEDIKKLGLQQSVTIPLAASRESKNFEHMSQINKILEFKDYENNMPAYLK